MGLASPFHAGQHHPGKDRLKEDGAEQKNCDCAPPPSQIPRVHIVERRLSDSARDAVRAHRLEAAIWKSSTTLPEGSWSRTCLPPGPERISLRNGAPAALRRATSP